jgi:hypothetical protein
MSDIGMVEYSSIPASVIAASGLIEKDFKRARDILRPESTSIYPFGKLNIMFYIDRFGDFISNKTNTAKICRMLFDTLDKTEQQEVMMYLMEHGDDDE